MVITAPAQTAGHRVQPPQNAAGTSNSIRSQATHPVAAEDTAARPPKRQRRKRTQTARAAEAEQPVNKHTQNAQASASTSISATSLPSDSNVGKPVLKLPSLVEVAGSQIMSFDLSPAVPDAWTAYMVASGALPPDYNRYRYDKLPFQSSDFLLPRVYGMDIAAKDAPIRRRSIVGLAADTVLRQWLAGVRVNPKANDFGSLTQLAMSGRSSSVLLRSIEPDALSQDLAARLEPSVSFNVGPSVPAPADISRPPYAATRAPVQPCLMPEQHRAHTLAADTSGRVGLAPQPSTVQLARREKRTREESGAMSFAMHRHSDTQTNPSTQLPLDKSDFGNQPEDHHGSVMLAEAARHYAEAMKLRARWQPANVSTATAIHGSNTQVEDIRRASATSHNAKGTAIRNDAADARPSSIVPASNKTVGLSQSAEPLRSHTETRNLVDPYKHTQGVQPNSQMPHAFPRKPSLPDLQHNLSQEQPHGMPYSSAQAGHTTAVTHDTRRSASAASQVSSRSNHLTLLSDHRQRCDSPTQLLQDSRNLRPIPPHSTDASYESRPHLASRVPTASLPEQSVPLSMIGQGYSATSINNRLGTVILSPDYHLIQLSVSRPTWKPSCASLLIALSDSVV